MKNLHRSKSCSVDVWPTLRALAAVLTLGSFSPVRAQSTSGSVPPGQSNETPAKEVRPESRTASASPAREDEPFVLSPFVVSSERDTGYQATSTLAGTRLNTPLSDLASAISVYTKAFQEDLGVTNAAELLVYATGMEAAGAGGNYSGAAGTATSTEIVGNSSRVDPQETSRTRGLAAPNYTRGYFETSIPFDSYNTDAVTVNRGPNAALFGVGSPAGVVDTSLLKADVQRNRDQISFRYGNNDSQRHVVDFNHVLVPKKLAVRIAALNSDERYNQRPAFEKRERIYGALTFEPFKSTALRANFESGHTDANRPISVLPFKSFTQQWVDAGRQGFDWRYYDDPALNPAAGSISSGSRASPLLGQAQLFNQILLINTNPWDTSPSAAFRSEISNTTGTAANSIKAQLYNDVVNRDRASDNLQFLSTLNISQVPAAYWTASNVYAGQLPGYQPAGVRAQGFTDLSAFDFKNHMIDETARQGDSFHSFNIAFSQNAWEDRIGVELAYDAQRLDRRSVNGAFSAANANHVKIDTNVTLPNGQPNPNLGRPFVIYGQSAWTNYFSERESMRATAFLKYDFTEKDSPWLRWLGRHTLSGVYEESGKDIISYNHRLAADGPVARAIAANINSFNRIPGVLTYIGSSIIGNDNPLRLEAIRSPRAGAGLVSTPADYFVRAANATDPGHFEQGEVTLVEINNGGSSTRELIKSQGVVLQSYWLKDNLITMAGWRRDEDYFARESINFVANPSDPNDPGKVHYGFNDFSFPHTPAFNVGKETKSYSAILRWPRNLVRLPAGMDVSVNGMHSSNFTPIGGRVNAFGESLPSPEGETKEFGLNVSLFDKKLVARINRFETSVKNQSLSSSTFVFTTVNAVIGTAVTWAKEGNTNPDLASSRNADIELLFSPLPANYRDLYQYSISGAAPNISGSALASLPGATDTTDYTAEGVEFEIVYNPTKNWRILANVAKQETIQTNQMPFLKRFVATMEPVWQQLGDRPKLAYPTDPAIVYETYDQWLDTNVRIPLSTALATEGTASPEQRKWRANLVTNYQFGKDSIFGGRLKGWSVGTAARWQDKIGIGYPTTRNADTSVTIDIKHPYYAPAQLNGDAWISYQRKLRKGKIDWKIQLNVMNLYGDDDLVPVAAQGWGEIAIVRLPPERRWYVTNTFTF